MVGPERRRDGLRLTGEPLSHPRTPAGRHTRGAALTSHSMRRWHSPGEPTAQVAHVMLTIAYRTQWCVLAPDPFLVRETVGGKAPVAEGPSTAPTIDTGPHQQMLLPFLWNRNDLHWDRRPRARWCGCRRVVRGGHATRWPWCRPARGRRTGRKAPPRGHIRVVCDVVIAVRVGCKGIVRPVNLKPVDAIIAVSGPPATS